MKYGILLVCLFMTSVLYADTSSKLNVKTTDGSVSTYPYQLQVTPGTLTDNGDGTATLTTGGGGGSSSLPLPQGATNYIQNRSTLQAGATAYIDFLHVVSSSTIGDSTHDGSTISDDGQVGKLKLELIGGYSYTGGTGAELYFPLLRFRFPGYINEPYLGIQWNQSQDIDNADLYYSVNQTAFRFLIGGTSVLTMAQPNADNGGSGWGGYTAIFGNTGGAGPTTVLKSADFYFIDGAQNGRDQMYLYGNAGGNAFVYNQNIGSIGCPGCRRDSFRIDVNGGVYSVSKSTFSDVNVTGTFATPSFYTSLTSATVTGSLGLNVIYGLAGSTAAFQTTSVSTQTFMINDIYGKYIMRVDNTPAVSTDTLFNVTASTATTWALGVATDTVTGPWALHVSSAGLVSLLGSDAPTNSQALCLLGGRLGHCTSVVGAGGGCTCVSP